jgi:hypothetical protein
MLVYFYRDVSHPLDSQTSTRSDSHLVQIENLNRRRYSQVSSSPTTYRAKREGSGIGSVLAWLVLHLPVLAGPGTFPAVASDFADVVVFSIVAGLVVD